MLKIEKKQVKIICIAVAAVFVLSIAGLAVSQTGSLQAAAAPSNIGKVDFETLLRSHPDFAKFMETMRAEQEQAPEGFRRQSADTAQRQRARGLFQPTPAAYQRQAGRDGQANRGIR